jgi:PilZ domain-containing protein
MYASVELHGESETVLLPARNISLGGVYLTADGHDLGGFAVGTELEVLVFDALDDTREPVRLVGEVVRHDSDGLALMWADSDPAAALALADLLDQLQPREPVAERATTPDSDDDSDDGSNGKRDLEIDLE